MGHMARVRESGEQHALSRRYGPLCDTYSSTTKNAERASNQEARTQEDVLLVGATRSFGVTC